mmetsp:Transcript_8009/g.23687  ORF Transcript_8009/g.23687 Transcript_8009/m.23687 type:complete len:217 (-) Transcript_8009:6-656(-)
MTTARSRTIVIWAPRAIEASTATTTAIVEPTPLLLLAVVAPAAGAARLLKLLPVIIATPTIAAIPATPTSAGAVPSLSLCPTPPGRATRPLHTHVASRRVLLLLLLLLWARPLVAVESLWLGAGGPIGAATTPARRSVIPDLLRPPAAAAAVGFGVWRGLQRRRGLRLRFRGRSRRLWCGRSRRRRQRNRRLSGPHIWRWLLRAATEQRRPLVGKS